MQKKGRVFEHTEKKFGKKGRVFAHVRKNYQKRDGFLEKPSKSLKRDRFSGNFVKLQKRDAFSKNAIHDSIHEKNLRCPPCPSRTLWHVRRTLQRPSRPLWYPSRVLRLLGRQSVLLGRRSVPLACHSVLLGRQSVLLVLVVVVESLCCMSTCIPRISFCFELRSPLFESLREIGLVGRLGRGVLDEQGTQK